MKKIKKVKKEDECAAIICVLNPRKARKTVVFMWYL